MSYTSDPAPSVSSSNTFIAKRQWLTSESFRLDATSYVGGGLRVREKILAKTGGWQRLDEVARVFRGPLHKRYYVRDVLAGVPYLTAADVDLIDLPMDVRLSRRRTPQLDVLMVEEGWTLISSAGTIGKTTFVREELTAFALSQDMLRVAPTSQIASGYLFSFLSSYPALAMIQARTYGSVVDRIEPKHISDLPIPVPSPDFEQRIHKLVIKAAQARTEASLLLKNATNYFDSRAGIMPSSHDHSMAIGTVPKSMLNYRLDAFHHVGWTEEGRLKGEPLGTFATVVVPGRMKLVHATEGIPFFTGVDLYQTRPQATKKIAKWLPGCSDLKLDADTLLMQVDGQRYGLIGRPVYAGRRLQNAAASWHLARIHTNQIARVLAFTKSASGRRAVMRHSSGTSVPSITARQLAEIEIPILPSDLTICVEKAIALRDQADADEEKAIQEVEAWLG